MNLIDLLARKDKGMQCSDGIQQTRWNWGGHSWRSLSLQNNSHICFKNFINTHNIRSRPDTLGWFVACRSGNCEIEITFVRNGEVLTRANMIAEQSPIPVLIPWPSANVVMDNQIEMVLTVIHGESAELLVQRVLSRQVLYDQATGNGVEIGPGPVPQIKPSKDTSVMYIEETSPEKWAELYDNKGTFKAAEADWSNILIGKAADLPVQDATLDFIFSSHVFEHLANPLGHLERWYDKLSPGGVVMAVVPEMTSTKDRYMFPCLRDEFLAEYETGNFEPEARHYTRYVRRLTGGKSDKARALAMQERSESIHVHFYDRDNITWQLAEAVTRFGYSGFQFIYTQNHKDFYFTLKKPE